MEPPHPPSATAAKTSGIAIASLICGIAGFLTGPFTGIPAIITGIPAIITGHLALGKIKKSAGTLTGSGLALTGTILGYITTVGITLLAAAGFLAGNAAIEKARTINATAAALSIQSSITSFHAEFGVWPAEGNTDAQFITDKNLELLQVLLGTDSPLTEKLNPDAIQFLVLKEGKNNKGGIIYQADGTTPQGIYDPWGAPYQIVIDLDFNDEIQVPSPTGTTTLTGQNVAVWSNGPDGKSGTKDDVRAW
jgi:hypothetical protein